MKGRDAYIRKLRALPEAHRKALREAVYSAADILAAEAGVSITTGSVGGKNHVPSKPGEPPNSDSGFLARSIHVEPSKNPRNIVARVVADAPYAAALEFGTSKMAERPFMRPAAAKVRRKMGTLISTEVRKIRGGK